MALPSNNTNRLVVKYNDGLHNHNLLLRFPEGVTDAAVLTVAEDFLTALDPSLYLVTILGVVEYEINTNVGFPVAWTGPATFGTGAQPAVNAPRQLRWEGYSFGGHKVSFSMWGGDFTVPSTYRFQDTVQADFTAGRNVLYAAMNAGTLCAIDGTQANMKTYINVNFNSYWERKSRI